MILLNATDISKSYTASPLLSKLSYAINEGDKIGLIGVNGTGKSTLLRITAGVEEADSGRIVLTGGVRIGYLPQAPAYDPDKTVLEQAVSYLTPESAAEGDYQCKSMLHQLGMTDFEKKMSTLSGGERKRVAMAGIFTNPCDILILDEPTNHIDSDTVEWLEGYLKKFRGAIFMVTQDRYFLDRVTNVILELTGGKLYRHEGNYEVYLENRAAREEMALATERKRRTLYRRELEWMRRGAQARTTKAKGRIERFHQLEDSKLVVNNTSLEMKSVSSRLGKKIIELAHVSKAFDGVPVIMDFSYNVLRDDRIGIIGENGSGKSTLLKLLTGELTPDSVAAAMGHRPERYFEAPKNVVGRPPALCQGCGHRDVYTALNEVVKEYPDARVFADIGCYTLGALPPFRAIDTCLDMGASITMAKGAADAGVFPAIAVIGDSTFTHSGMTALLDAVNDKAQITVIISDNLTTAMTGGQDSAGTNKFEAICLGLGVEPEHVRVVVPLPKNMEEITRILREEIEYKGVSVIIPRRECIQTLNRKLKQKRAEKKA